MENLAAAKAPAPIVRSMPIITTVHRWRAQKQTSRTIAGLIMASAALARSQNCEAAQQRVGRQNRSTSWSQFLERAISNAVGSNAHRPGRQLRRARPLRALPRTI